MKILYKLQHKLTGFSSFFKLWSRKKITIEKGVKVNLKTFVEDNVKIYHDTKILGSSVGRGTYIGWNSVLNNVRIGRFCSIAPFVEVVYGRHAVNEFVSSHPAFYSTVGQAGFSFVNETKFDEVSFADKDKVYRVNIGNDVWIGYGAKIMEGVTIGDGAIIGAGSIVTKNVEAYGIYVGIPAKKIKSRFDSSIIRKLMETQWWDKEFEWIDKNSDLFECPIRVIEAITKHDLLDVNK